MNGPQVIIPMTDWERSQRNEEKLKEIKKLLENSLTFKDVARYRDSEIARLECYKHLIDKNLYSTMQDVIRLVRIERIHNIESDEIAVKSNYFVKREKNRIIETPENPDK